MAPGESFIRGLVAEFPGLAPALDEHIRTYGEVLPHVFLADVKRHVVAGYQSGEGSTMYSEAQGIVNYLEAGFRRGDEDLKELISVSFVELLPRSDEPGSGVRELLGPELSAEASRVLE